MTPNTLQSELNQELHDWLRLAFVGLPAGRCNAALERWETPSQLLEAAARGQDDELLSTQGVTPTTVQRLREAAARDLAPALEAMAKYDIRLLLLGDSEYPMALGSIPDPPPYLFVRGTIEAQDEVGVAIVGTRHTTEYGRGVAAKLATDLAARGVTVVSGLARGVDTAAHRGALEAGGRTFAVCGCGLDITYPSENRPLMEKIAGSGAALSEFAPTVHPEAWHFPARNRIISGLSAGVVVVEAGERSGALITADFAMEQGRDVFAVPGNIHKIQSRGAHALIKQGATLVESADDVLEALNNRALPFEKKEPAARKASKSLQRAEKPVVRADLSATENRVYLALEVEPRHLDDVAAGAGMGPAEASATLVVLEIKGLARRLAGGLFARTT
jgi:DNA processing protein